MDELKNTEEKEILTEEQVNDIALIADQLVASKSEYAFYFANLGYENKNLLCCHLLGYCYRKGVGVEADADKANKLFDECFDDLLKMADDDDNSLAQLYVGFHYLNGYGKLDSDTDDAFDYFAKSRLQGNSRAQAELFEFASRQGDSSMNRWARDKAHALAEKAMEIENEFMESGKEDIPEVDIVSLVEKLATNNTYMSFILANWYEKGVFTEKNVEKSIFWHQKSAISNVQSMVYLAKAYENGNGVSKDLEQAFTWYMKAATLDDVESINKVGDFYYSGIGVERDYDQSFIYHEKAANLGLNDAIYKLGIHYYNAEGTKKDVKKCLSCYEKAALNGYALAEYKLGACYNGVYGVDKDEKKAQYWFIKAALNGNQDAADKVGIKGQDMEILDFEKAVDYLKSSAEKENYLAEYTLGRLYEKESEYQDLDKALEWYQTACEHNYGEAFVRFGLGEDGKGYAKDTSRFVYWYERALNGANPLAKMRLGQCYELGYGIEQSDEKALSWYDQSALAGCALAQFMLGNFYFEHNKLVEKDDSKAVYYYDLAANEDYVKAQMALADCYEKGFGTEKNINLAVKWYQRAAELKNHEAEAKLKKFKKKSDGTWTKKLF